MTAQLTSSVIMIRPAAFGFNPETAESNVFQQVNTLTDPEVMKNILAEFDLLVQVLRDSGIEVLVFDDTAEPKKPDAVFPNNWLTTHADGTLVTYPMYSPLRRLERQPAILDQLEQAFRITRRWTLEVYEEDDLFLEGTGSMILDRVDRKAYACTSPRTDPELLKAWCTAMDYEPVVFQANHGGIPVYHTNVIMAIGKGIAAVCLEDILPEDRLRVRQQLADSGKEVVELTSAQVDDFAGNMLALKNKSGQQVMVMSTRAYNSLSNEQRERIEKQASIVHSPVPTIERIGGGSVRCMIAENFFSRM